MYVATQVSIDKKRALKVMRRELLTSVDQLRRFQKEARLLAEIESESDHIVNVIAAGVDVTTQRPWLAMELLEGHDLSEVSDKRGPLHPAFVGVLVQQLCHALRCVHERNIVHRDLKPENIFICPPKRPGVAFTAKLLDFGIAKSLMQAQTQSMTTGAIGTPAWMAPEQALDTPWASPATDVWALGLIAFKLLAGKVFWSSAQHRESRPISILREVLDGAIPPASERARALGGPELPRGFDAWFARCVSRDVADRFPNARAAYESFAPIFPARDVDSSALALSGALSLTIVGTPLAEEAVEPSSDGLTEIAGPSTAGHTERAHWEAELRQAASQDVTALAIRPDVPRPAGGRSWFPWAWGSLGLGAAVLAIGAVRYLSSNPAITTSDPPYPGDLPTATSPLATTSSAVPPGSVPPHAPATIVVAEGPPSAERATKEAPRDLPRYQPPEPTPVASESVPADFDRGAASAALSAAALRSKGCVVRDGPTGSSRVQVTFAPSGRATQVNVGPPFAGTPTGNCITASFRDLIVPPFSGSAMTVSKTINLK